MSEPKNDDEIEVTPEMIEAGLIPLYRYDPERGSVSDEETVRAIYRSMRLAAPQPVKRTEGE